MQISEGQIWISKENPHKSLRISHIGSMWDNTDEGMFCLWEVYDVDSWERFIINKKFNGIGVLEDYLKQGKNTFPYPFGGECSIKSMKQRIRKDKLGN